MADRDIREASLEYHRQFPPGKISLLPTKQLTNQRDLALAYTPGVAAACDEIVRDPAEARNLTARGNLIGVVTNGTAVLGLGAIGPLASKPVMEGKAVLFKKFAGIDCFDIEVDERDPEKLVDIICALEPTFGGINLDDIKARYAQKTDARKLADIIGGADIFLGLSAARVLKPELLKLMAEKPLILALANPEPEIMPDLAKEARPDAVMATGRSDFPNQVNNVLCFPFIFRGALDVGATTINEPMKLATVRAIADLAMAEQSDIVAAAYGVEDVKFGPDYLIPKPFDPRLIVTIAPAVAKAAMESGVATRPISDFDAYRQGLSQFVYHSGLLMKPIFQAAKKSPMRIVYAEGEEERILRAAQVVIDEGLARPTLIGRPAIISQRIERYGLRIRPGVDVEIINPEEDSRYRAYWTEF